MASNAAASRLAAAQRAADPANRSRRATCCSFPAEYYSANPNYVQGCQLPRDTHTCVVATNAAVQDCRSCAVRMAPPASLSVLGVPSSYASSSVGLVHLDIWFGAQSERKPPQYHTGMTQASCRVDTANRAATGHLTSDLAAQWPCKYKFWACFHIRTRTSSACRTVGARLSTASKSASIVLGCRPRCTPGSHSGDWHSGHIEFHSKREKRASIRQALAAGGDRALQRRSRSTIDGSTPVAAAEAGAAPPDGIQRQ